ncbi:MAG: glycosyltransferase [Opitutaceae bacterium]
MSSQKECVGNQGEAFVFYVPYRECIDSIDEISNGYWDWINQFVSRNGLKWTGPFSWTLQSYLILKNHGMNVQLAYEFPSDGIVITHTDFLKGANTEFSESYIIEIKPDRNMFDLRSNALIVQNKLDPILKSTLSWLFPAHFVYYWPQPDMLKRELTRGTTFENIVFSGNIVESMFDAEGFQDRCKQLGLEWTTHSREKWNDFSNVDCIVAVRGTGGNTAVIKPATKLYNAWLAGVPAILSPDEAFMDLRRSDDDFLIAQSEDEAIAALKMLRDHPPLRERMIRNGLERSVEFTDSSLAEQWSEIFENQILPSYIKWNGSKLRRVWHLKVKWRLVVTLRKCVKRIKKVKRSYQG